MIKKRKQFQIINLLGIIAYLLMATSCFLPFLNYTTLTSTETITYFQSNGKMILAFSLLAIFAIIINKFKYTFMCLGFSIGIYAYDITFGLLDVVREKTTVYSLQYGFYLLAVGMFINLIYIYLKKKSLDREYNNQFELSDDNEKVSEVSVDIAETHDNSLDIKTDNPQMQLLNGYQFANDEIEETNVSSEFEVKIEEPITDSESIIQSEELSFDDISLLEEIPDVLDNTPTEEIKPSLGEQVDINVNPQPVNSKKEAISIFNEIPNMDILDNDVNNQSLEEQPKIQKAVKSQYKFCNNCGMQISSEAEQCPVCGKYF